MTTSSIGPPVMSRTSARRRDREGPAGPLDVRLAVEIDPAGGCPLQNRDLETVRQSLTRSEFDGEEICQVAINNEATCHYQRTPVDKACPCTIIEGHDCIADLESVRDGTLVYSLVVPERATLRAIIEDLRKVDATVSLEQIRSGVDDDPDATVGVTLTEKQREALAVAIGAGYYEDPREASLDDLADELGITPSGVSQRLNAIERKLVRERGRSVDALAD